LRGQLLANRGQEADADMAAAIATLEKAIAMNRATPSRT
jgi:hypothetical protein